MSKSLKILVCGDVCGNFSDLFKRVSTVIKKTGPYEFLLCVGEFFSHDSPSEWKPYKERIINVPLPVYVLGPTDEKNKTFYPDIRGCELADNVIYLGPSGIYPCSNGLKIAYLSGSENTNSSVKSNTAFSLKDIKALETSAGNRPRIDILITSEWPNGVFNHAKVPDDIDSSKTGSVLISRLAYKLKPRYHFVGLKDVYYERLPYRNHQVLKEPTHHVTRFIALAKVHTASKKKWLYAMNTVPIVHLDSAELIKQPPDVTECPYTDKVLKDSEAIESKKKGSSVEPNQFFYDTNSPAEEDRGRSTKRKYQEDGRQKRKPPVPSGPCWFCLASPEVEKHLIVSVGTYCYLALAKGGLVPDHLLILPIEHFQSSSDVEETCREEIEKFKASLKKYFESLGKVVVFFERNYRTQHMQIQVVPLPTDFLPHIKESFDDISESSAISLDEVPKHSDIAQLAPSGTPFFYVELPDGKKLFHRIRKGFPLQFGREVLASPPLLNMPEKVDWRECPLSQSDAAALRDQIRETFKPFDFTIEEDDDDSESSSEESEIERDE